MMFPRITLTIEPVGAMAADLAGLQATIRAFADELRESRKRKAEGSEEPPRARAVPPGQHVPPGAAGEAPPGAVVEALLARRSWALLGLGTCRRALLAKCPRRLWTRRRALPATRFLDCD